MFLTVKQLCERWSVSSRHVQRLVESGDLVAIDLSSSKGKSRSLRFSMKTIEEFEQRRTTRVEKQEPVQRRPRRRAVDYVEYV